MRIKCQYVLTAVVARLLLLIVRASVLERVGRLQSLLAESPVEGYYGDTEAAIISSDDCRFVCCSLFPAGAFVSMAVRPNC
jgi:hypothetical protein